MKNFSDDVAILRNWNNYVKTGRVFDENSIRKEILESWERSKKAGLDPLTTESPRDIVTAKEIYDAVHLPIIPFIQKHLLSFYDFLEENNAVIYILSETPIVSVQGGSKEFLKWMNSMNMGIGSSVAENQIGTNAASLALLHQRAISVVGAEHYAQSCHGLACIGVPLNINSFDFKGAILFVTQKNNFNIFQINMVSSFANLLSTAVELEMNNIELNLLNDNLNLSLEQSNNGIIYVSNFGKVLNVNQYFVEIFGMSKNEIINGDFRVLFPDLKFAMECMKNGEEIHFREITFRLQDRTKTYFMDCHPTSKAGSYIGITIVLSDKKKVHGGIARIANYRAHYSFDDLIGSSPNFVTVKNEAKLASKSSSSVIILGESGTGKELFAQAIHNASRRAKGPFISINCGAIPRELIGSELFGYVEGAFTGARSSGAPGKFELADKGTIFLDEIGEMPPDMQVVLLRVLEERVVTRLGGNNPISINVQVITATNRDLWELVISKQFRSDLYYRLNVMKIEIPLLRERKDDIPLLVEHFLKHFSRTLDKQVIGITSECSQLLYQYEWPGNVRELRNVIERGVNQADSRYLTVNNLPKEILVSNNSSQIKSTGYEQELVEEFEWKIKEKRRIMELMLKYNGNKARVAKELGITRATLYRRLDTMEQKV